jgi:hypothetical protein
VAQRQAWQERALGLVTSKGTYGIIVFLPTAWGLEEIVASSLSDTNNDKDAGGEDLRGV